MYTLSIHSRNKDRERERERERERHRDRRRERQRKRERDSASGARMNGWTDHELHTQPPIGPLDSTRQLVGACQLQDFWWFVPRIRQGVNSFACTERLEVDEAGSALCACLPAIRTCFIGWLCSRSLFILNRCDQCDATLKLQVVLSLSHSLPGC